MTSIRIRQIEAFQAAIETGSVTRAAALLGIGQPAVSRLIADLESSLGFPVFHRSAGRITPTTEGLRFHAVVERAFLSMKEIERAADQIRHAYNEHLVVSTLPVLASTIIPGVIQLFVDKNPKVSIDIDTLLMTEILQRIQDQRADVAMSVSFTEVQGVRQEHLIDVRFVAALPHRHRLAKRKVLDIRDFDGEDYISIVPSSAIGWERIDKEFEARGVKPRRRFATKYSHTAYSLVAAGLGVSILEPFAAEHWSRNGVAIRPLSVDLSFTYSLFFPEQSATNPIVEEFVFCLRRYLRTNKPMFN
jgi:DNA-binding transcriptional LysR family regulator